MEKFSLDKDWNFHLGDINTPQNLNHSYCYRAAKAGGSIGASNAEFDLDNWKVVDVPHDWSVYGEFDKQYGPSAGYKQRGTGWYSKHFRLDEQDKEKQLLIEFDGISSHAIVYFNGSIVGRNFSGYNSFVIDITDMAVYGEKLNTLVIFVDATPIEGWWYEGAGIYRHVYLYKKSPVHIKHWGIFVNPQKKTSDTWDTKIEVTIENSAYSQNDFTIKSYIKNQAGTIIGNSENNGTVLSGTDSVINQSILVYSPDLWDIDSPNLYTVVCEVYNNDTLVDSNKVNFGYRTISIYADDGFHLNGRRVQLYGTCNHQDHAGVGVAVPDSINEHRIKLLKEMGTNAYRCAHGNPNPEILDYCDKYGLLVMDENRNFNSSSEGIDQLKCMVLRDRNHPSVVMYSIFNEEPHQGTPIGRKLAKKLENEIKKLDNTRFVLGAMNGGVLNDDGCGDILDITGVNYSINVLDKAHEKLPNIPITGSENNSAFQTRGVYETDMESHVLDSYDTKKAPWGSTHRDGFMAIDTRPHVMGMFIWTGFDYRGEPTPFEWPSIGTQFGILDTCGFKKDAFYLNKAFFTKEPMIHVLPHWNWQGREGEEIKVMVHTNCEEAELFLNNVSQGRQNVHKYDMAQWSVAYEPGTIRMVGYIDGKEICEDSKTTSGQAQKIVLTSSNDFVYDSCMDCVAINAHVVDENGIIVPTASNKITFTSIGGNVIGVGNGDPNSHEVDKCSERHLFNGLCQAIVQQNDGSSQLTITAQSDGLESCTLNVKVIEKQDKIPYIKTVREKNISSWRTSVELSQTHPDPNVKIDDHDMNTWEVVNVGNGIDEKFKNAMGFGIYKTTCDIQDNGEDKVLCFKEILGDKVEIYIDGNLKFQNGCSWPKEIEIPIDKSVVGTIQITVIIESTNLDSNAGIMKSVVLI